MATRRMDRVNGLLRQLISDVISKELSDPRLDSVISVTRVNCWSDLRRARVYISVYGEQTKKNEALSALKSASGFIHRAIRKELSIKTVPFLEFQLDKSIEQGAEMLELIKETVPSGNLSEDGES